MRISVLLPLLLLAGLTAQADDDWKTGAAMPTARKEINNATVVIGTEIYVVGGVAADGQITGALEIYDTLADSWRRGAPLPVPVWRSGAAAIDGRLYLFGGYLSTGAFPFDPTANSWEYGPAADVWTAIADLPLARGSLVALAMDGRAHVIGGATSVAEDRHHVYDPANDTWSEAAPLPKGRSGLTGTVIDAELYVTGGYILDPGVVAQTDLDIYDPAADQWRAGRSLPSGRLGIDAASYRGKMLVFGGAASAQIPSRTLEYDPVLDAWSERADMPQPASFMGVAAAENRIQVIGGGAINLNRFDGLAVNRTYTPKGAGFTINGGLGGAWFNPQTPGQGVLIEVLSAAEALFLAWFTFDEATPGKVGDPQQRWFTAQGPIDGNRVELTVTLTSGGGFDSGQAVSNEPAGVAVIEFSDCTHARFDYVLNGDGRSGGFDLQRLAPDVLCADLASPANDPETPTSTTAPGISRS